MKDLEERLSGKYLNLQWDVAGSDTYNGLLSTASLTRYMLNTAWRLVAQELKQGVTSIAALVQVAHEEPTPAGETVTVEARVTEIQNNVVKIALKAVDETGLIAHGFNERHVIDEASLTALGEKRAAVLRTIL